MDKNQIKKLMNSFTLPDTSGDTELFETHISWVILTDEFAFKIKRPVSFSFVDFSELELREHFCHKEIELNRRLAPNMYLDVIPIKQNMLGKTEDSSNEEEIIEYAVQMKRMNNEKEMDKLLKKNEVNEDNIIKLAEKIAAFHKDVNVIKNAFEYADFMDKYADIRSVKDFISRELSQEYADIIDRSINQCNNYINTHRSFINERVISGYHRDCHGDLNAHNIFLYDDPVIFDCIEFNDEFRYIDVLNDIAFLCVDLDYYGYSDYSELFYQRYLQSFELEDDRESRDLFNFYKSYRANIRAKVTALSAQEKTSSEKMKEDIKKYLNLMNDYFSG